MQFRACPCRGQGAPHPHPLLRVVVPRARDSAPSVAVVGAPVSAPGRRLCTVSPSVAPLDTLRSRDHPLYVMHCRRGVGVVWCRVLCVAMLSAALWQAQSLSFVHAAAMDCVAHASVTRQVHCRH